MEGTPMPAKSLKMKESLKTKKSPKLKPRLPAIADDKLTARQKELMEAIRSGPRGRVSQGGPFGVYLHAPDFGDLTQKLGAHCRYQTGVPPRLSEFAILCTAREWRAQYEWHAHAAIAEKAGVAPATIRDIKAGRAPKAAKKDERAIYDFVRELYKTRRVSERTYKRVQSILGDVATVELVGILGYYGLVAMMLDVFNVVLPEGAVAPFAEK
jgi:4-carboxymuconolactone decarboxylase